MITSGVKIVIIKSVQVHEPQPGTGDDRGHGHQSGGAGLSHAGVSGGGDSAVIQKLDEEINETNWELHKASYEKFEK